MIETPTTAAAPTTVEVHLPGAPPRRVMRLRIGADALVWMLRNWRYLVVGDVIPQTTRAVGLEVLPGCNTLALYLEDDSFPTLDPGQTIPEIDIPIAFTLEGARL